MYKTIVFLAFIIIVFTVCTSGNKPIQPAADNNMEQTKPVQAQKTDPGKAVYIKYCLACHQMDGSGVPGMYPPIQKTDWVSGDKNRLIKLVLNGIDGPIEVNGEEYNQAMPQHKFLTDQQVADVLTYIRKNFGNKADAITPAEVARVRKAP
jgi:mono/diheme cytochrome c family protein